MSLGLYALGVLAALTGLLMVGFGIPINEFSLGNTLILAGTTAFVGGLIIVGLAAALRQLNRIADALSPRPAQRTARPVETPEPPLAPTSRPGQARVPFPTKPRPETREPRVEPQPRDPRGPEPRLASSEIEAPIEAIVERPRPSFFPPRTAEPPVVDDGADVPLSPRAPAKPNLQPLAAETQDLALEPKAWPPSPNPARSRTRDTSTRETTTTTERARSSAETVARSGTSKRAAGGLFDSVWPPRPAAAPEPETREVRTANPTVPAAVPQEAQPISILKSGLVDGMAYTLYTDGSIEAELAEGLVRFGSIEELRTHLEKNN